jgi:hypothetical protein
MALGEGRECMSERDVEVMDDFTSKVNFLTGLLGWGIFIAVVATPLSFIAGILVHSFFMTISAALLLATAITFAIMRHVYLKERFQFWIDAERYNPFLNAMYYAYSGGICGAFLTWWGIYLVFGSGVFEYYWPEVVLASILIPSVFMIIVRFAVEYRKKKVKGTRGRYFSGKKADIDETVRKALGSLGMVYEEVKEGSHWTGFIPAYRIENSGISIIVSQAGFTSVSVTMKTTTQDDIPKAREIERAMDSLLSLGN